MGELFLRQPAQLALAPEVLGKLPARVKHAYDCLRPQTKDLQTVVPIGIGRSAR
jgi:hypothetical protein